MNGQAEEACAEGFMAKAVEGNEPQASNAFSHGRRL